MSSITRSRQIIPRVKIRLPQPHEAQSPFVYWSDDHPDARFLIAPCGTKFGKSMGCAIWMVKEALTNAGLYCCWIAPTYLKSRIGYRYIRSMIPDIPGTRCLEHSLDILLSNGSMIKFLHGRDAEVTVEGEGIDRFVIDEAGKQTQQLWNSLMTTLSVTGGIGIVTGTPRGYTWYHDLYQRALGGNPLYLGITFSSLDSPYVDKEWVDEARALLPPDLFDQYYKARFVSSSSVFGNIDKMFDESLAFDPQARFWIHPDEAMRSVETVTGWDIAKHRDYSVFYTVNAQGKLVGYARFNKVPYDLQVRRLKSYLERYFPNSDRSLRYDATGVGSAVADMLVDVDIDVSVTAVTFSLKSKQEMVGVLMTAIETGWHTAPRIAQIEREFLGYDLAVTSSGMIRYSAPDGQHDDVVSAAMLAVSGAFVSARAEAAESLLDSLQGINSELAYAADILSSTEDDDFFDDCKFELDD